MSKNLKKEADQQAAERKKDHIAMALESGMSSVEGDRRFSYEPMLNGHTVEDLDLSIEIAGKTMRHPLWISSMTGGTEKANTINHNLARLCGEYGLGMGLGSCRQLLYEDKRLSEFDVKHLMPDSPLMINLGIAQIEELIKTNELAVIDRLIEKLSADGLIIHINPLQEWMQPEGDRIKVAPITTVQKLLEQASYPVMVKEVGQGFGRESIEALLKLPIEAIDLAGYGGTNFSKLELLRSDAQRAESFKPVLRLGHTCEEMLGYITDMYQLQSAKIQCKKVVFSGGIKGFLDGYYFINRCPMPSIYAQASAFLKYAMDYDKLKAFAELEIEGMQMSHALLKVKT